MGNVNEVQALQQDVNSLASSLEGLEIDIEHMDKSPADENVVAWYKERFNRCIEDGVPDAITCYLTKLLHSNVNDMTRLLILQCAMNMQLK